MNAEQDNSSSHSNAPGDAQNTRTRKTYYYLHDHNNNVVGLIDRGGNRVATYEYGPYGEITHQSGPMAKENPIRYSSEFYNSDTGLVEYLFRQYNPMDGRWLQRDPIAELGGNNLYGFVYNNPVSLRDRTGLETYKNDLKNCTRTMIVEVNLDFRDGEKWTESRKQTFKDKLKNGIENKFNNNNYATKPDKSGNCYKPRIEIQYVDSGGDWRVKVYPGSRGKRRESSSVSKKNRSMKSYGKLYEDSVEPTDVLARTRGGKETLKKEGQIPSVHEFGHALGLDHPGVGVKHSKTLQIPKRGSLEEYTHQGKDRFGNEVDGPTDLMGRGKGLRPFYFQRWN